MSLAVLLRFGLLLEFSFALNNLFLFDDALLSVKGAVAPNGREVGGGGGSLCFNVVPGDAVIILLSFGMKEATSSFSELLKVFWCLYWRLMETSS